MANRPILFSAPMVLAMLEGRKTQTRRVLDKVKLFSPEYDRQWNPHVIGPDKDGIYSWWEGPAHGPSMFHEQKVRYAAGDLLWVREAHAIVGTTDPGWVLYRASGYEAECERHEFDKPYPPESDIRWRPSIHMPRWASRLTLEVTEVRVERLQDISIEDAFAEGINQADHMECCGRPEYGYMEGPHGEMIAVSERCCGSPELSTDPRLEFAQLWDLINTKDDRRWADNPWIVALTFIVHRENIDSMLAWRIPA